MKYDHAAQYLSALRLYTAEIGIKAMLFVQLFVGLALWAMASGLLHVAAALPAWALAIAGGGAACLTVTALLLTQPKLFFGPLFFVILLATQIGAADFMVADPNHAPAIADGTFPSLTEWVNTLAWLIAIGLALGGVFSGVLLADAKTGRESAPRPYR